MKKQTPEKEIRFALRIPESLWNMFKRITDSDRRSLNAELIWLIEKAIGQKKKI